jgi:ribonuclease D
MAHVARCPRVGMDTEFVGEDSYHPKLCLIQLAAPDALYLVDPFAFGEAELKPLWELLVDPARLVVVHAGREEVRMIHRYTGRMPGNLFDLQVAAGLVGLTYPIGHGNLVREVLDKQLSKAETLTEWRGRPLSKAQIRYAFDDVRYLLALWEKIDARLGALGRRDWAREEFARLCEDATPDEPGEPAPDKWRRVRGASALDRRRLAILREIYHWREAEAEHGNRPPRTILRDDLLVEIARRGPKDERDLHVVRGLAKRFAGALFAAIERARALPPDALPLPAEREQDPPQFGMIANVLNAALADFCARNEVAPNLVATSQDIKLLVRAKLLSAPPPADSLLTRGWRAGFALPHLDALLAGRRALVIDDVQSEHPFGYQDKSETRSSKSETNPKSEEENKPGATP